MVQGETEHWVPCGPYQHRSSVTMTSTNTSTVLTQNPLLKRSQKARASAQDTRQADYEKRKALRDTRTGRQAEHLALFTAELLETTRDSVTSTTTGPVADAVKRGFDGSEIERFYLPAILKGDDGSRKLLVPTDATYFCSPGADEDTESTPIATLLQGFYDWKTKTNQPEKLPGGKTVIRLINELLEKELPGSNLYKCVLVVEMGGDPDYKVPVVHSPGRTKPATCMKVMLVWDLPSYTKRRAKFAATRKASRDARVGQKKAITLDEHLARKATGSASRTPSPSGGKAAASAPIVDSEGFTVVTTKGRRKPVRPP